MHTHRKPGFFTCSKQVLFLVIMVHSSYIF